MVQLFYFSPSPQVVAEFFTSNSVFQDPVDVAGWQIVGGSAAILTKKNGRNPIPPQFIAGRVVNQLTTSQSLYQGSPWENGYVESFNGKLRDELLNREIFLSLEETRYVIDRWRLDYNHYRIHSSLDYQTPAAFAAGCVLPATATPSPPEHSRT